MNELINQQSISRTAHPPLKIRIPSVILQLSYPFQGDKFFLVSGLWQLAHLYLYSPRLKTLVLIPIQFRYLKVWALVIFKWLQRPIGNIAPNICSQYSCKLKETKFKMSQYSFFIGLDCDLHSLFLDEMAPQD